MTVRAGLLITFCVLLAGAGCAPREVILTGDRQDIRAGLSEETANVSRPISLPAARTNAEWTHRGGSPSHLAGHPALPSALTLAFATDIGQGETRRLRITADPVVAGGRIFTLDASAQVSAVAPSGELLWARDISPSADRPGEASGGGLAAAGGRLYVTTGFGELVVLDQASGGTVWRQNLNAVGSAAPTVAGDLVYVVDRNSRAWALETSNGRIRWTIDAVPSVTNYAGGAGVAATSEIAVFPFPSGEVIAAFPQGGLRRWSSVIAGNRPGAAAGVAAEDIAADPVIVGDRVYVGNFSGRVVAMSMADGERIWTATEGAMGPLVPIGGSVFLVNDVGEVIRLDASNGEVVWRVELPQFVQSRPLRQTTRYVHFGPIMAGGRLIVASTDGTLRQFDPRSGALIGQAELPGGAASNPVVAGGALYVVNRNGQLLAFR